MCPPPSFTQCRSYPSQIRGRRVSTTSWLLISWASSQPGLSCTRRQTVVLVYFLWSIWSGEYQQYQLSVLNIISSGSWFMVKLNKILFISVLNIVTVLKHWTSVCSVFDGAEVQEFFLKQELFVVAAAAGARINKLTGANKSFLFFQTSWPKNIMTGLK